jgi:hypothetical protein
VATHYLNWQDAQGLLDKSVYTAGHLDMALLQRYCADVEREFDNRLRLRYEVPFVRATQPEAFQIAVDVCSRWAAARYLRNQTQAEGATADDIHYPERLEAEAEKFMLLLETRKAPADAAVDAAGIVYVPQDGVTTEAEAHKPFFRRDRVVGGAGHW